MTFKAKSTSCVFIISTNHICYLVLSPPNFSKQTAKMDCLQINFGQSLSQFIAQFNQFFVKEQSFYIHVQKAI